MERPKNIGDVSTLAITLVLRALGYGLYIPYGENTRCDLMLERDGFVDGVQCKTGRLRKGAIIFNVCSSYAHHRSARVLKRTYHGEIDLFAVYCPETAGVYLIPIGHLPARSHGILRVDPPKNNQVDRIRFAADYEVGRVAIEGLRGSSGA
ncbi:MAG TPA: group I intron-associated PD-(D/E)XK endonuclease [Gaiellaceae bacterium]|nr:group I intron-associated PD-(D/E)XK endonuclease [Gaiellaceae bacterium]